MYFVTHRSLASNAITNPRLCNVLTFTGIGSRYPGYRDGKAKSRLGEAGGPVIGSSHEAARRPFVNTSLESYTAFSYSR